jgi:hypothetical protein
MKYRALVFCAFLMASPLVGASLEEARAEPNLDKRSVLAISNAVAALKDVRAAYNSGDLAKVKTKAQEVEDSVELAYDSLEKTGKDPRRSPRWFKHAEMQTSELLRSIDGVQNEMSLEDRPLLDKTKDKVQQVHDNLLTGLMGGKRK